MEGIVLGCDIGTGSCKLLAWHTSGVVIKEVQSFYDVQHPKPGYSEQDPELIKHAFITCLKKIIRELPSPPLALGFSSCMHSLILVNENAQPITPLITWEDNRSSDIARRLRNSSEGKSIYINTGTPIHSMSPLCKITWFKKNKKDLFKKAYKFIGIKEYLWHWMFGVYEVDQSIASATGLFDIKKLTWYAASLRFCGIDKKLLSTPVTTTFNRKNPSNEFLQATGLPPSMLYCIGASDGCMANVGSHISGTSKAAVTIGTSGAVRITTKKPIIDYDSMIFNYLLDEKTFVSGGPVNNGGNTMHWMFNEFLGIHDPTPQDYSSFESSVSLIPAGCNGLICLPYFYGERAPVWDEKASAIWFGVNNTHTKFYMMRAVMEGVCYSLRMILETIERASGNIKELYLSGGFIKSPKWVQMLADITRKKVVINELADASSIGAAMWAVKAMKQGASKQKMEKEKIILPQKKTAYILNKQYEVFNKLYGLTKKQMHILKQ